MAYRPLNISMPHEPDPISIKVFGGIDYTDTKDITRSPDAKNIILDEQFAPDKRPGYKRVYQESLGTGQINGLFLFHKKDGTKVRILHHGTKLYIWEDGEQPVQLFSALANAPSVGFVMNDKLYIMDGTNYLEYDGTNVIPVESVAYIPTITINRTPTGGGDPNEALNLLQPYFKDSFNATGSATDYTLSLKGLDASPVTASYDGGVTFDKVETTHFNVNRTTGVITFLSAPPAGQNNLVIKAAKTISGNADRIKKCNMFVVFGGTNDTRIFVTGNPDYRNMDFQSGLYDPTYFPDNKFTNIGSNANPIMRYEKMYNSCLIIKNDDENDVTVWKRTFNNDPNNPLYALEPLTSKIGCCAKYSGQLVNNNPVFLSKYGIQSMVSTNVKDERNIQHISGRIDKSNQYLNLGLLREGNLQNAVSADYNNWYILCINDNAYVFDYRKNEWYYWTNIPASCFIEIDGYLYFGSNKEGLIYQLAKPDDTLYNDDGVAIDAYWKSVLTDFDYENMYKIVPKCTYTLKPGSSTSVNFAYATEKGYSGILQTDRMDLIDFENIDFSNFSFITSHVAQPIIVRPGIRQIVYFQVILSNNVIDESFGFTNVNVEWDIQGEVK